MCKSDYFKAEKQTKSKKSTIDFISTEWNNTLPGKNISFFLISSILSNKKCCFRFRICKRNSSLLCLVLSKKLLYF